MATTNTLSGRGSAMSVDVGLLQAPDIDGLVFRPFVNADDYQAIADLIAVSHLADGDEYVPDAASLQIDWETIPGFSAPRDIILAEVQGRLIAYGGVDRQVRDGVAVYDTNGTVHPDFRRRGLGRTIVRRNRRGCVRWRRPTAIAVVARTGPGSEIARAALASSSWRRAMSLSGIASQWSGRILMTCPSGRCLRVSSCVACGPRTTVRSSMPATRPFATIGATMR